MLLTEDEVAEAGTLRAPEGVRVVRERRSVTISEVGVYQVESGSGWSFNTWDQ